MNTTESSIATNNTATVRIGKHSVTAKPAVATELHFLFFLLVLGSLAIWRHGVTSLVSILVTVITAVAALMICRQLGGYNARDNARTAGSDAKASTDAPSYTGALRRKFSRLVSVLPVLNGALVATCFYPFDPPLNVLLFVGTAVAASAYIIPLFNPPAVAIALSAILFPETFIHTNDPGDTFSTLSGAYSDLQSAGFTAVIICGILHLSLCAVPGKHNGQFEPAQNAYNADTTDTTDTTDTADAALHRSLLGRRLLPTILPAVILPALYELIRNNVPGMLNSDIIFASVLLLFMPATYAAPRTTFGRLIYGIFAGGCNILFLTFAESTAFFGVHSQYPFVYAAIFANAFGCGADTVATLLRYGAGRAVSRIRTASLAKKNATTYDKVVNAAKAEGEVALVEDKTCEIDFLNYNMPEITSKVTRTKRKGNLFLSIRSKFGKMKDKRKFADTADTVTYTTDTPTDTK